MALASCILAVQNCDQASVVAAMKDRFPDHDAFVSPRVDGWVTVHDAKFTPFEPLGDLCEVAFTISMATRCLCVGLLGFRYFLGLGAFDPQIERAFVRLLIADKISDEPVEMEWLHSNWSVNEPSFKVAGMRLEKVFGERSILSVARYLEVCALLGIPHGHFSYRNVLQPSKYLAEHDIQRLDEFVHLTDPDPRARRR